MRKAWNAVEKITYPYIPTEDELRTDIDRWVSLIMSLDNVDVYKFVFSKPLFDMIINGSQNYVKELFLYGNHYYYRSFELMPTMSC